MEESQSPVGSLNAPHSIISTQNAFNWFHLQQGTVMTKKKAHLYRQILFQSMPLSEGVIVPFIPWQAICLCLNYPQTIALTLCTF